MSRRPPSGDVHAEPQLVEREIGGIDAGRAPQKIIQSAISRSPAVSDPQRHAVIKLSRIGQTVEVGSPVGLDAILNAGAGDFDLIVDKSAGDDLQRGVIDYIGRGDGQPRRAVFGKIAGRIEIVVDAAGFGDFGGQIVDNHVLAVEEERLGGQNPQAAPMAVIMHAGRTHKLRAGARCP